MTNFDSSIEFIGFQDDFEENFDLSLENKIGKGASSIVYKCKNKKNGKFYAVKKFNPVDNMEDMLSNLLDVFGLLRIGMIENNSVINLHQIFAWTESSNSKPTQLVLVIVTDLCEGGTLTDLISKYKNENTEFPIHLLEKFSKELISGFDEIVTVCKVLHRDIKPDNLLIHNDCIKIFDFNVSKLLPTSKTTLKVFIIVFFIILK